MSSITGLKTKKVTTYGRKKTQVIPILHEFSSPESTKSEQSPVGLSPTANMKRPPLINKRSHDFSNLPSSISAHVKGGKDADGAEKRKGKAAAATAGGKGRENESGRGAAVAAPRGRGSKSALRDGVVRSDRAAPTKIQPVMRLGQRSQVITVLNSSSEEEDDDRIEEELSNTEENTPPRPRRPRGLLRRRVIDSPSSYAPSPRQRPSPSPGRQVIDSVEIPVQRPRRVTRPHQQRRDAYREVSVELSETFEKIDLGATSAPTLTQELPRGTLKDLLSVCSSTTLQTFNSVLPAAFSIFFNPSPPVGAVDIVKVGEASYSEVFCLRAEARSGVVMKLIPLAGGPPLVSDDGKEVPYLSETWDVMKEIEITKKMSRLPGGGFVIYRGAYVIQGCYTPQLLKKWDEFKWEYGSANSRPSLFKKDQKYVALFLSDGGSDLEAFRFDKNAGWVQAAGMFWQVADALARAEAWAEFEHRDLHEGQILLQVIDDSSSAPSTRASQDEPVTAINYLDPSSTSIRATIIDFGLSRLRNDRSEIIWTGIPDDIFAGEGPQWDVYRATAEQLGGDYEKYMPISNVMYIVTLLLQRTKTLKKPRPPVSPDSPLRAVRNTVAKPSKVKRPPTAHHKQERMRSEAAYGMLRSVKAMLDGGVSGRGLAGSKSKKTAEIRSAGEMMVAGRRLGWIV